MPGNIYDHAGPSRPEAHYWDTMNSLTNAGESPASEPVDGASSDLTLLCLPAEDDSGPRLCAWSSTVSAFLLFVGTFGFFRKPLEFVMGVAKEPDPVAVIFEPPPQTQTPDQQEPAEPDKSDPTAEAAPSVTVVAASPTEVAFAVPVVGRTIVGPARMATAPPINNVVISRPSAPPAVSLFTGEENRSDFPYPTYPLEARKRGMSGKIMFVADVDASGSCTKIEVKESSGHSYLDSYASDWVRRRWVWPPGQVRRFEIPFTFSLERR